MRPLHSAMITAVAVLLGVDRAQSITTVFFNSAQGTNLVNSGTTSDTISSAGYLFKVTRDKLFTGGIGLTNPIGRALRVHWPEGLEAQAVTAGPVTSKARIDVSREDGEPFSIQSFTAQLLGNTWGTGAALEIMPMLDGEDAFPDPFSYDATGFYGMRFTHNTPQLTNFEGYKVTLFVDYALMSLTVVDSIPALAIERIDTNLVQVSWSASAVGYSLEYATNLPAQAWSPITNSVLVDGSLFIVEFETTGSRRFYRLRK